MSKVHENNQLDERPPCNVYFTDIGNLQETGQESCKRLEEELPGCFSDILEIPGQRPLSTIDEENVQNIKGWRL